MNELQQTEAYVTENYLYPSMTEEDMELESDLEKEIDNFEIVDPQFFAQLKEPTFTVNVDKVTANAACVRMMPNVDYVEILINRESKKLALRPCTEMDISGYKWAREKNGKRYASQRTGEPFVLTLCQIMGWNPDYRYKIFGRKDHAKGMEIMVFDLTRAQPFPKSAPGEKGKPARRSVIPMDWNGKFGPTVGENRRSLHVETYDGFKVLSIKGDKVREKTQSNGGSEEPVSQIENAAVSPDSSDNSQTVETHESVTALALVPTMDNKE